MSAIRKTRLVVIGGGMAGTACVEEVIKAAPDKFDITVFGKEPHPNYNRILLSHVLTGEKSMEDIAAHGLDWYAKNGVTLRTGCNVTAIRRGSRAVMAGDEELCAYDKLIIATGAVPVMPRIPGMDKAGVFTFRDIADCERIRYGVGKGTKAVILGGGLLGLEAAYGCMRLGADSTVAHLMDRLMERQCDAASAAFLREDLERLGIRVLLGKEAVEISGGNRVEGIRFKDGSFIDAGAVIVSIGIRPNIELAASSGVYCERGVVVSDTMQTFDPAVYAVGECVQHRGETFGLVGPVFEQARVIANHLAGDSRLVFRSRPVSARLKVPGIDLYSAGDVGGPGGDTIEYIDRSARVYKKAVLRDGRVAGVVMYGDSAIGPRLYASLIDGEDVSHRRGALLFGDAGQAKAASSIEDMPGDAIVCGCNGVTKAMIVEAIEKKGLFTRSDVARETKASTSCGGCAGLVDRILEATLGSSFQGSSDAANLCGCTKYTRDDVLKNIREKRLTSVMAVMETLGWETVGCDTCRPALNYYVSMVWPLEAVDDATSRLVNERGHANIQKDGTFSVVPRMYGGVVSPEELKRIAECAVSHNVKLVKLTGGQRIDLIGVKKDELPAVWAELGMDSGFAYGKALRTVKTCVGSLHCRYGTQDSLNLGVEMEKRLTGLWMPAKVKMSASGCPRNCAESGIKDVGIVGVTGGFEIYAGGCGGIELKAGERLCTVKTAAEAMEIAGAFIQHYREDAHYGERTFKWVRRRGMCAIRKAVVEDAAYRAALCGRLDAALSAVRDPWKGKGKAAAALSPLTSPARGV
ncbi:MAG: NAD(P)/FAD-dependent oxidoreductase [Deltaproteobacteria bacterium]|nr:NAD(P)/FAD-dependent oxidoreductase [Deltaproteobacteria bacterium]